MAVVSSVDYVNKRVYLSASTVNADVDTLDVYREVRALRVANEAHRAFAPMIVAGGGIAKIPGVSYTPAYVQLVNGCRIVPYDTSHALRLVRDTFTDDGQSGVGCFDRSLLSSGVVVDIDVDFPEIEIRRVVTGGNEYSLAEFAEAMWAHQRAAATAVGSMGERLKNAATVDTVGEQLKASL